MGISIVKTKYKPIADTNYVMIAHNLNEFPFAYAVQFDGRSYGFGMYGINPFGNEVTVNCDTEVEYMDTNSIKVNFSAEFPDVASKPITMINARQYQIQYTPDLTINIFLK